MRATCRELTTVTIPSNPWFSLPASEPYVLPCDREAVERHNDRAGPQQTLDLGLFPFPLLGNPNASVVMLNLNPGIDPQDRSEQERPAFRAAYRNNLRHADQPYPFFLLDPAHGSHPGHRYWSLHLRQLIEHAGIEALSRELLVLEWVPYASQHGTAGSLELASQEYTTELLRAALSRGAAILGLRSLDQWLYRMPELARYPRFHRLKPRSRRNWVTRRNLETERGFEDLVRSLPARQPVQAPHQPARGTQRPNPQPHRTMQGNLQAADVDAVFAELQEAVLSLGADIDPPRPRGQGTSFAFNRRGCLNFACITKQKGSVLLEAIDETLKFAVAIHVGGQNLSLSEALPTLQRAYDHGGSRRWGRPSTA